MKLRSTVLVPIVVFPILFIGLSLEAWACECGVRSSCFDFAFAQGVYTGKLTRIETDNESKPPKLNVYFDIHKTYKGKAEDVIVLSYTLSECNPSFISGEDYLIYHEPYKVQRHCNPTRMLSYAKSELEYLDRFQSSKPLLKINGSISKLTQAQADKIKIEVRGQHSSIIESGVNKNGDFEIQVPDKSTYTVRIIFPSPVKIEMDDGDIVYTNFKVHSNQTVVEYVVSFDKTYCDFRDISVVFEGNKGTTISNMVSYK